jgi:uncharacterized membrane protein YgcG
MSAHYGAPVLRRPQFATPAYSPSTQGSSIPARSAPAPAVRRRAMVVAAATLCAPAFAVLALAAIGATGSGGQAGVGSLAGTQGLRGSTEAATPALTTGATKPSKDELAARKSSAGDRAAHHTRHHPAANRPTRSPVHQPAPPPSIHTGRTPPHLSPPTPETAPPDPTQPGAPTTSGTTSGSGGTSGSSGTSSTTGTSGTTTSGSGSGPGGGSSDVYDTSGSGGG